MCLKQAGKASEAIREPLPSASGQLLTPSGLASCAEEAQVGGRCEPFDACAEGKRLGMESDRTPPLAAISEGRPVGCASCRRRWVSSSTWCYSIPERRSGSVTWVGARLPRAPGWVEPLSRRALGRLDPFAQVPPSVHQGSSLAFRRTGGLSSASSLAVLAAFCARALIDGSWLETELSDPAIW